MYRWNINVTIYIKSDYLPGCLDTHLYLYMLIWNMQQKNSLKTNEYKILGSNILGNNRGCWHIMDEIQIALNIDLHIILMHNVWVQ